jgi:hypothetical protein
MRVNVSATAARCESCTRHLAARQKESWGAICIKPLRAQDRAAPVSRVLRGVAATIHAAFISLNAG